MDAPEPDSTPFSAVTAQTSRFTRVSLAWSWSPRADSQAHLTVSRVSGVDADRNNLQAYQAYLDKSTPYVSYRWIGTATLLIVFLLRIVLAEGWYIGIYPIPAQSSLETDVSTKCVTR